MPGVPPSLFVNFKKFTKRVYSYREPALIG